MRPGRNQPPTVPAPAVEAVRPQVEEELRVFLERQREEVALAHPDAVVLVDELIRLVSSGGKRLRPAFCYWGHRAAGGRDGRPIVLASAALELLHTFALVHDDVMDRSAVRRGVASTHMRFAGEAPGGDDAAQFGLSMAILTGDLATVLADRLLLESGFSPVELAAAKRRYDAMRVEMAVGQYLDLTEGRDVDEALARRISALKSGSYTVEGPLHVGAALAGGSLEVMTLLSAYGAPLGEAFQVRDDVLGVLEHEHDLAQSKPTVLLAKARTLLPPEQLGVLAGDPGHLARALRESGALDAAVAHVNGLVARAESVLDAAVSEVPAEAVEALRSLAQLLAVHEEGGRR